MYNLSKNLVVLDCEVYPNYFLAAFKNLSSNKVLTVETKGRESRLDETNAKNLKFAILNRVTFGFNSLNYDLPVIYYALMGATCEKIYKLSKSIIDNSLRGWQTINHFNLKELRIKHFDIQEVAFGVRTSLKLYGARLHAQTLQDLPLDPHQTLTKNDMQEIKKYCINDLNTTILLYQHIINQINLRASMSEKYNINLLSKSDAQIAESVFKTRLSKQYCKAPIYNETCVFKYKKPDYISFQSEQLKTLLESILSQDFKLNAKGKLLTPEILKCKLKIGEMSYKIGIGGIHSTEKRRSLTVGDDELLVDKDVVSYYPSIILNQNLYPQQMGEQFLNEYRSVVEQRIDAKNNNDNIRNETFKILINGSFGKFLNRYSSLYSPQLFLQVVLSGQLTLLMLIEELERNNIHIVSANTDGVITHVSKSKYKQFSDICKNWENKTKFKLEETRYKSLHSRDVNNYIAIKDDGSFKTKGIFATVSISKNAQMSIVNDAIQTYFTQNKPIVDTIKSCNDIRKFLIVRTVTSGAVYKNQYLGRVVRWIYVKNGDQISYKKNGNKVAKSDGCVPIMTLPNHFPGNIDYDRYICEAEKTLSSLGTS